MTLPARERSGLQMRLGSPAAILGFWLVLALSALFVAGPWAGFHAVLLCSVGMLMAFFPPAVLVPRLWLSLGALFVIAACAAFLPAAWFAVPPWRARLEALHVDTGWHVVIQSRQAAEYLALFVCTLIAGLWITGHRASPDILRAAALAFLIGVAVFALAARMMQSASYANAMDRFGFFPNRNHSATYLAMGAVTGLGCLLQALRDKRFVTLFVALAATAVCLWALAAWSVSRAGIVLVLTGSVVWMALLGTGYLGRNGLRTLALIALAGGGLFLLTESDVKSRLTGTVELAEDVIAAKGGSTEGKSMQKLDFRIPTALDTFELIREFPWTGIGAGQFLYVFPQYRQRAAIANDSYSAHPESDWLWMASEAGLPATLALAALVLSAAWMSARGIRSGRDRALRAACLVAALLVAVHGLFDVPGHRITLAWSAALLFALSLQNRNGQPVAGRRETIPFRGAGIVFLGCGLLLASAQWRGIPDLAVTKGATTTAQVWTLYHQDLDLRQASPVRAAPEVDLLESSLPLIRSATQSVPLDREIRYLQGFIASHFEDLDAEADNGFEIERALDPRRVQIPMRQATAWSNADPARTAALWAIALNRAAWMDDRHPGSPWEKKRILQQIEDATRSRRDLRKFFRKLDLPDLSQ